MNTQKPPMTVANQTWHDSLYEAVRLPWPLPSVLFGFIAFASLVGAGALSGRLSDLMTSKLIGLFPVGVCWISLCLRAGRQRLLRSLSSSESVFNVSAVGFRDAIQPAVNCIFSNRIALFLAGMCFVAGLLLQPGVVIPENTLWSLQFLPDQWLFQSGKLSVWAVTVVVCFWVSAFAGLGVGQVICEAILLKRLLRMKLSVHPVVARYRLRALVLHQNRVGLVIFGCAALVVATLWSEISFRILVIDVLAILSVSVCVLAWPQIVFHMLLVRRRDEMLAILEANHHWEIYSNVPADLSEQNTNAVDVKVSLDIIATFEILTRAPVWAFDTRLAVELAFFLVVPFLAVFAPEMFRILIAHSIR